MKNTFKKVIALVLTVTMAVGMAIPSFANSNDGSCPGHTFYARKLAESISSITTHHVGNQICTITTWAYVYTDVCSNCGYAGPSYTVYHDTHSVSHG